MTSPEINRAYLGLGSNLGDRGKYLRDAVAQLASKKKESIEVVCVSDIYETEPVGGPEDQPVFWNIVVAIDTSLSPRELLKICFDLECAAERVRLEKWGPRTLDVDILAVGNLIINEVDLVIPHPEMARRRFVIEPLSDIAPEFVQQFISDSPMIVGEVRKIGTL